MLFPSINETSLKFQDAMYNVQSKKKKRINTNGFHNQEHKIIIRHFLSVLIKYEPFKILGFQHLSICFVRA